MSKESVKAYMSRLATDSDFRSKINAISDMGKRMAFQKEQGFDFSPPDIGPALAEMTDQELAAAGGGACRTGNTAACGRPWDRKALQCSAINGGGETCSR